MKILVIVVTYNGLQWLDRCLGSVRASELPADLYVWDNDSVDGSADFVASHYPEAKLTRSADNLGFAEPNNMGMRYALDKGYDYVYLLNQDAWIEPSTLGTLVSFSESHPEYGVLSPLQMTDGFKELDKQFKLLSDRWPIRSAMTENDKSAMTGNVRSAMTGEVKPAMTGTDQDVMPGSTGHLEALDVKRIMAAHWLVPCRVLEKVGVFDSLFPIYGNDDNWCDRARYHGFKVGIVPEAKAVHDRAYREEPKEKVIYRNYYMGSLVRLCDINRPLWERFLFVCLFTVVKAVKYGSILPFKHFGSLCKMLPEVKISRLRSK